MNDKYFIKTKSYTYNIIVTYINLMYFVRLRNNNDNYRHNLLNQKQKKSNDQVLTLVFLFYTKIDCIRTYIA